MSNLLQMRAGFVEFWRDKWNWLESLSLLLLAGGLTIRILNSDVHQGRALFALSAPLVFSRVLFFGQFLKRQGLVIQASLSDGLCARGDTVIVRLGACGGSARVRGGWSVCVGRS